MKSISYRPEIDGLRALAILPVIAFHLGVSWLPGGFVGVDVFFVISGYLISAIILKEHSENAFTFKNFWLRRVRRILPAMLLMLLATVVAGYFILFDVSWASLGYQSISALLVFANMEMWHLTQNYWAPSAETLPLLHTWSLSVEEQFYLFYPLFIVACLKWFPKKLPHFLAGIFGISLVAYIFTTRRFPSAAFYLLPTRAWELAAGCFLATLAQPKKLKSSDTPSSRLGGILALLGILLIAASWFVVSKRGFPGYKALLPVAGSMLVIQFAGGKACLATTVLSWPVVRYIGKISYSLYLWHWPVIVLERGAQVRWENMPTWPCLILIPVLAIAAYYTVEQPGRHLRHPLPYVLPGVAVVIGLSFCLTFMRRSYDISGFAPTVWMGKTYSVAPREMPVEGLLKRQWEGITAPERDPQYAHAFSEGGIIKRYGGEKVDILVLGNSHALMWAPVLDEICQELHATVLFYLAEGVDAFPSIPPVRKAQAAFSPDEWVTFESNRVSLIRKNHPRLIIISARWLGFTVNDRVSTFLQEVSKDSGSEVLFIEDPPELVLAGANVPEFFSTTSSTTFKTQPQRMLDQHVSTARLRSLSEKFNWVHTVPVADMYFAGQDRVKVRDGNQLLYRDDDHLSLAGAHVAKERIKSAIAGILDKSPPIR